MTNDKAREAFGQGGDDILINGLLYRLDGLITQGADSRICSAHFLNDGSGSAFVVKHYPCLEDEDVRRRCMREAEAGLMLKKSSHVVPLLGYSVRRTGSGTEMFLLFERLECLASLRPDLRGTLEMCRDVSSALVAVRRKGLIHGDVKPSNIYRRGNDWLLGDFGSVCLSGEVPVYASRGYCAPEVLRGERCDIRSDIYSLGITCYRLLSGGRLPFCDRPCGEPDDGEVRRAIDLRLAGAEIPPVPEIPQEVNRLVLGMCRFAPKDRLCSPGKVYACASKILRACWGA